MKSKLVKKLSTLFLLLMVMVNVVGPVKVFADSDWNSINDVDVSFSDDGDNYSISQDGFGDGKQESTWNKIFTQYKGIIVGITGIGTLTMIVLFIFNFMKLGKAAGNPNERSTALTGLLWTGIAAAGLGAATIFVAFSSNLLH